MAGEINVRGLKRRDDLMDVVDESPFTELNLVADKVLPVAHVQKASAVIPVKPVGNGKKVEDTTRATGGGFNRGSWDLTEESYVTNVAGWEEGYDTIDDTVVQSQINLDQDAECAMIARNTVLISREQRVANAVYDTALFTGVDYTLDPNWGTDDVKTDIRFGADKIKQRMGIGRRMLTFMAGEDTIDKILDLTAVKESIKYVSDSGRPLELLESQAKLDFLAKYLRVGNVIQLESLADTADLGINTSSFGDLWNPDFAMLAYLNTTPSFRAGGLGVQPNFDPYTSDIRFDEYDNKATSQHLIRASEYRGQHVRNAFGFLYVDIWA